MTRRFLDTNILLYSISRDPDDRVKRDIADRLLAERDNALSVQVLQEFYVQATRATRPDAVAARDRRRLIRGPGSRFPVQDMTVAVMSDALDIKAGAGLSLLGRRDRRGGPCARLPRASFGRHGARTRDRAA